MTRPTTALTLRCMRSPTMILVLLLVVACAGDDSATVTTDPATVTTDPSTTADGTSTGDATDESTGECGTTWAQNECTKQAIDCIGDNECANCPACDSYLSGACGECEKYGSACGCAAAVCSEGYYLEKGQDAVVAGCNACLLYCDPNDPGQLVEIGYCTDILEGTAD